MTAAQRAIARPIARLLALMGQRGPWMLVIGIVLGLALPRAAALLRPWLPTLVFLLAAATMLRIEWAAIALHFRNPLRIALVLGWGLLVSPVLTAAVVTGLGLPAGLEQAVVIWSASPALISAPALAFLVGLDGSLALIAMVLGSLLMPFTLPPMVLGLLGVSLEVGVLGLTVRLGLFIGGALLLATVVRRLLGSRRIVRYADEINGFNVLLLVLFAIAIMDGVPHIWATRPHRLLLYAATAFCAAIVQQILGTLAFLWSGRVSALTVGMICGNRNMASVWASLGSLAPPELTLFLVALQLPIYTLPVVLQPLYRRLSGRLRGARVDTTSTSKLPSLQRSVDGRQ